MSLKYYLYVSDTKLDMLFAQLPRRLLDDVAGELKLDLKILAVSLKQGASEPTRYSKLALVCRYLEKHERIGSIDAPEAYFRGSAVVRWGPFGGFNDQRLIYFGGATEATVFGLGGSPEHVIGAPGGTATHASSVTPCLTAILCEDLALEPPTDLDISGLSIRQMQPSAIDATRLATERMQGVEQHVEFLARRLLYQPKAEGFQKGVLLGSPIYVALHDTAA